MMLITSVIALPIAYTGARASRLNRGLRVASGLISLGFGLFLAYQVGIGDGLFTGHVQWTPH
jgi:high-affinity nickel-transport protein